RRLRANSRQACMLWRYMRARRRKRRRETTIARGSPAITYLILLAAAVGRETDLLVGPVAKRLLRRGAAAAEIALGRTRHGATGAGDNFKRSDDLQRTIAERFDRDRTIADGEGSRFLGRGLPTRRERGRAVTAVAERLSLRGATAAERRAIGA